MSGHLEHIVTIDWCNTAPNAGSNFLRGKYSREHTWTFDGGIVVPASPSPHVVPVPYSNPAHVDPEEAFVAAIASCHMLTYLYVASKQGFPVESYCDRAVGILEKLEENGAYWVSQVTLNPRIVYSGEQQPTAADVDHLHHLAHEQCFIANSIKTRVLIGHDGTASGHDTTHVDY